MSQNSLQLPEIITGDMPSALIPEAAWELQQSPYSASSIDTTDWGYYTMPLSPPTSLSSHLSDSPEPPSKKLRLSESPDRLLDSERQHCIPTQKVFDLPEAPVPPSPSVDQLPSSANPLLSQKFLAPNAGAKRTRGSVERISTKDFVPPDVSGLSKREARLVKNRAAAFLSRQRKREEFEAMEVRVRQLEDENARLQHLAERGNQHEELHAEIDRLRMQLQAAEKRELNLSMEISRHSAPMAVKAESSSECVSSVHSPDAQNTPMTFGHVRHTLLRALPSLLSLSSKSPLPISSTIPLSEPRAMGEQLSAFNPLSPGTDGDPDSLHALGDFIISFDTSAEEGLVRVRVQPSRSVNKAHPNPPLRSKLGDKSRSSSLGAWSGPSSSSYLQPFVLQSLTSPPPSLPVDAPSPTATMNQFCGFLGPNTTRTTPDYHTPMMPYMPPSFHHVTDQQPFELFPNSLDHIAEDKTKYQERAFHLQLGGEANWQVSVC